MRALARGGLLALNFLLLAAPSWLGPSARAYATLTALVLAINIALVLSWAQKSAHASAHDPSRLIIWLVAVAAGLMVFVAGHTWLHQILTLPNDSQRADMLIVIQHGIRRMLQGRNPYTIYKVPWDATLPYGPVMWAPFAIPHVLHADVRFMTVLGELFVPVACALAAVALATNRRYAEAAGLLIVIAAIASSPTIRGFTSIGHTPVYWPLIALFVWLVARERWHAAAVAAGLLVVARSTMIAIALVFLLAVWHRDRRRFVPAAALMSAAALVPYLPFALWDPRALAFALYGSYQKLMKEFVWTSTDWAQHTIGVTGLLLRRGWQRAAEPVQASAMLATFFLCSRALRSGRPPVPWMALALLVFSMTTLWPVDYVYLDVFVLLVCAAVAETPWIATRPVGRSWIVTLGVSLVVLAMIAWISVPTESTIDVGTPADRQLLYAGFAGNEREPPDRTFAWVDGRRAELLIPRRSRQDADLEIVCQPNVPTQESTQEMSVTLNGIVLGTARLGEGWQPVVFAAPGRAWIYGANELVLSLANASSPLSAGISRDARELSVAVDRVIVRTR